MLRKESTQLPYLKSLANCLDKIRHAGYTAIFNKVAEGLQAIPNNYIYPPGAYKIINTFQFETISHPGTQAFMYMIETNDGVKGTLVNDDTPAR